MSARFWFAPIFLATTALVPIRHGAPPLPAGPEPAAQEATTTTLDDQAELAVTIYNSDLALVRDVRNLQIARGTSNLHFMDIAATVNPATVHFRSLTEPSRVSVLEQNYEYDLLEPEKLLRKYVGREVTLIRTRPDGAGGRDEEVKARLLSYNNAPVWEIGGEIVTGMRADSIKFPELPGNLYSRPTLIWTLENGGGTRHRVEASYLAGKLSWNADYVLTVARDDKAADIDGWVTVVNGSGTSFTNAKLQLVAGDLNRVRQVIGRMEMDAMRKDMAAAARRCRRKRFPTITCIPSRGRRPSTTTRPSRSICLAAGFPVQKRYVVEGRRSTTHNAQHPGAPIEGRRASVLPVQERRRRGSACRCRRDRAGARPTRGAACSSSARIASITHRRTKRSTEDRERV